MGTVLIACMCVCMGTKELLSPEGEKCEWIETKSSVSDTGDTQKYNCDKCSTGSVLTQRPRKIGKLEMVQFTCGKAA